MKLLPVDVLEINAKKLAQIDALMQAIYRLIIYSRYHLDDDLLDIYQSGFNDFKELLSIKNAQMEAQTEEEAQSYLIHLKHALDFVTAEIILQRDFEKETQLFHLLRLISPESYARHPNRYRQSLVQIGAHLCPEPVKVPQLVSELFFRMSTISSPIVRAVYFHHELIRIHPFVDGNGRVTRIAKNWMLMYALYPPIFIDSAEKKQEYISTLENSFKELMVRPGEWNSYTGLFFEQELDRLVTNAQFLYDSIHSLGQNREKLRKEPLR